MLPVLLITLHLILLHVPGGGEIRVNIEEISSIRDPVEGDTSLIHGSAHCVLGMANGKFIAVAEDCREVILKLAEYDKMDKQ